MKPYGGNAHRDIHANVGGGNDRPLGILLSTRTKSRGRGKLGPRRFKGWIIEWKDLEEIDVISDEMASLKPPCRLKTLAAPAPMPTAKLANGYSKSGRRRRVPFPPPMPVLSRSTDHTKVAGQYTTPAAVYRCLSQINCRCRTGECAN